MNTQQLESFVQVAENLSFARAAEALNVTQSTVSRQIQSLEEELGTQLLHRSTRVVALTPAGISFLNDAKEILMKFQISTQKLRNHSNADMQFLSVGCFNTSYLPLITPLLQKCRESCPEIHPFLRVIPFRAVFNIFIHDEIDILFGFKEDLSPQEGLHFHELVRLPVCFAMSVDHPLADRDALSEQDVMSESLVICNSHELPATVTTLQSRLSQSFSPESTNYCENLQAMLTLLQAGYGIGLLPELPDTWGDVLCVPVEPTRSLSYGVFYRNKARNSVTEKFLALLKNI